MTPRFYTLWAINGPLDEKRLCAQLDQMRAFGFDGAVFHPRFFPGVPPYLGSAYMAVLSQTILYAKSIDMEFWIYDEDGWPSGTVGGQLLRAHPDGVQQWADLVVEKPQAPDAIGSFEVGGKLWHIARRNGLGVDYLNPNLARHFLSMTHERYRTELDPAAFEYVSTFFSDEPEFGLGHAYDFLSPHGAIPWTPALPALYEQRYGEPLAAALPGLFFPVPGHERFRVRFWELLTDLFCDAFISPIDAWCRSHGKRLAAHVKGEEHPLFQVPTHGSAQQIFRRLSLPGIDALERDPSNDFFPRQVASTARQFGDGRSMVECFGGAGWGATPDDLRRYLIWLGGHGLTDFVLHLWQYRLNSHAIRDWPASIPNHIGWADAFPQLLRELKPQMAATAARAGVDRPDTLLLSPHRGIMQAFEPAELLAMNVHDAGTYANSPASRINDRFMALVADLQQSGCAYHIADERTFEGGAIEGNHFKIGHVAYRRVLLPEDCVLSAEGNALASQLTARSIGSSSLIAAGASAEVVSSAALPATASSSAIHLRWSIVAPSPNEFPLEPMTRDSEGSYLAAFTCDVVRNDLSLVFADDVTNASVNGHLLLTEQSDDGSTALIPAETLTTGKNLVEFCSMSRFGEAQARPFVWIRGDFGVFGDAPFKDGPGGTVSANAPLVLRAPMPAVDRDLTIAGYPFIRSTVKGTTAISLPAGTSVLRFLEIDADVARVEVDGAGCGFAWGPQWQVHLPKSIGGGKHDLVLTLYPSAFNTFGPHHHYKGDIHIVSPVQFAGKKNFADDPDAPDQTLVKAWHVKPLRFPSDVLASPD